MREELFEIRGSVPVLWTIPFWTLHRNPEDDEIEMWPAIPLLKRQEQAIKHLLSERARRVNGIWMITPFQLKQIGDRVEGDPEQFFSWEKIRIQRNVHAWFSDTTDRNEFLDELYQVGIASRDMLEFLWKSFCNHMFDWLVNKGRTVDLYFAKLHPTLKRPDWKLRTKTRSLFNPYRDPRPFLIPENVEACDNFRFEPFIEFTEAGYLIEVEKEGICRRFIELELTDTWRSVTKKVERIRLERLKPEAYAEFIRASLKRERAETIRFFRSHLVQIRQRTGKFRRGRMPGTEILIQTTYRGPRNRQIIKISRHPSVRRALIKARKSTIEKREARAMRELSALQQQTQDVRNGGKNVLGTENAKS